MSQLAATGRPVRAPRSVSTRQPRTAARTSAAGNRLSSVNTSRRVEAVAGTRQRGSGFMMLVGVIALMGVIGLLMLNTMRAEQSFTVSRLQGDVSTLQQRQQQLESDLSTVSSPENLAVKADALGMVRASSVKYVRAKDHKPLGVAKVDGGGQPLNVETLPDTPANKVASQMLEDGSIGAHIGVSKPASSDQSTKNSTSGKKAAASSKPAQSSTGKH